MPKSDVKSHLQSDSHCAALQMMQRFGSDAALIAWGQADIEADCGRFDLSSRWIGIMELILAHSVIGSKIQA